MKAIVSIVTPLPEEGYYILTLAVESLPGVFQPYEQIFQLRNPVEQAEELEVDWADPRKHDKGLVIIRR